MSEDGTGNVISFAAAREKKGLDGTPGDIEVRDAGGGVLEVVLSAPARNFKLRFTVKAETGLEIAGLLERVSREAMR